MSILYNVRIMDAIICRPSISEVAEYCFDAMEDNFRSDLKYFDIDLSDEPRKIDVDALSRLLEGLLRREGITEYEALLRIPGVSMTQLQGLRDSVRNGDLSDLAHYRTLLWNNLLARLLGRTEDEAEVLKLKVQAVSIHPDAGFPRYRMNARATKGDERRFLIRLLADIGNDRPANPIEMWFAERGSNANTMKGIKDGFDAAGILWGFRREKKSLKLRPESAAFWKKHREEWWADLQDYLKEKSDNQPYELVDYDIMIHPSWFENWADLIGHRFDCAAHWM